MKSKKNISPGCLILVLSILAIAFGSIALRGLYKWVQAQSWDTATAIVTEVSWDTNSESDTYSIRVRYEYTYHGTPYIGTTLSPWDGFYTDPSYWSDLFRKLEKIRIEKTPVPCYINPSNPRKSHLLRDMWFDQIALWGGITSACLVGIYFIARKWKTNPHKLEHAEDASTFQKPQSAAPLHELNNSFQIPKMNPFRPNDPRWKQGKMELYSQKFIPIVFGIPFLYFGFFLAMLIITYHIFTVVYIRYIILFSICISLVKGSKFLSNVIGPLWKYGNSHFTMETFPGILGEKMIGTISIPKIVKPKNGFNIKLSCIERVHKKTSTKHSITDEIRWEYQSTENRYHIYNGKTEIPIEIELPVDCFETNDQNKIRWTIGAWCEVPGIKFNSAFEIPVYAKDNVDTPSS